MLIGAHSIIYSTQPEADRNFLRDVLKLSHVDVGEGWLIFGLPPAELAVHPSDSGGAHELYLMCDDIRTFASELQKHGVFCSEIQAQSWGLLTHLTLPGGGLLGVYEPQHARPKAMAAQRRPPRRVKGTRKPATGRKRPRTGRRKAKRR
ncbi:MAG TPA: extradiol dioxygenase [Bacteroidota bacterium]|nr:extradiol dioxygenase [Bacteroidota bacterium]